MQRRGVRSVVPDVLSPDECAELIFIHRGEWPISLSQRQRILKQFLKHLLAACG